MGTLILGSIMQPSETQYGSMKLKLNTMLATKSPAMIRARNDPAAANQRPEETGGNRGVQNGDV